MKPASEFADRLSEYELDESLRRTGLSLGVAKERLDRLLRTAFRDGDLAIARFHRLVRLEGPDEALAIAEGRGSLPRRLWLGALRGGLLNRSERTQALTALRQLSGALSEVEVLRNTRTDLEATRVRFLEERDRQRLMPDRLGRDETRTRDQGLGRRRKILPQD